MENKYTSYSCRSFYVNERLKKGVEVFTVPKQTGHSMQICNQYYAEQDIQSRAQEATRHTYGKKREGKGRPLFLSVRLKTGSQEQSTQNRTTQNSSSAIWMPSLHFSYNAKTRPKKKIVMNWIVVYDKRSNAGQFFDKIRESLALKGIIHVNNYTL